MQQQQLERLINVDFPWLWAIRPSWSGYHNAIVVYRVPHTVAAPRFLWDLPTAESDIQEVWVKVSFESRYAPAALVERIKNHRPSTQHGWSWARLILNCLDSGVRIDFLVAVDKTRCGCARVWVYRPPNKSEGWRPLLEKIAQV